MLSGNSDAAFEAFRISDAASTPDSSAVPVEAMDGKVLKFPAK
jgi:hypothetical protein